MTSRRAYTLIEILIVLALLSLLMAIALPNIGFLNHFKEKQDFNELKRDLMYYKNKAITENCHYKINIDINANKYEVINPTTNIKIKSKELKWGLKFINTKETTTNIIKFSPSGAPSTTGTFVIQRRNGSIYKFSITPVTGKVNIYLVK